MSRGNLQLRRRGLVQGAGVTVAALATGGAASAGGRGHQLQFVRAALASDLVDFVGVNTHFNFRNAIYGQTDRVIGLIEDLGVRHIRDHVTIAPQVRHAFGHLQRQGVRVQGVCSSLGDPVPMEQIIAGVAAHFRRPAKVFSGFEPLNEPNNDGKPWINETRAKTQALRQARDSHGLGDIPVLAPALARLNSGGVEGATTAEQAVNLGSLAPWVDLGNMHVYPRLQVPRDDISRLRHYARLVSGKRPVVCSETGYFNAMNYQGPAFPTPPDVAGKYYPRLVMEHWLRHTVRVFAYELLDDFDPTNADRESNFGLVAVSGNGPTAAWTPKPAYVALKNLLAIFKDPHGGLDAPRGMRLHVSGPADVRSILFVKSSGVGYLAVWRDVSSYDAAHRLRLPVAPEPVRIRLDQKRDVAVYDPVVSKHRISEYGKVRKVELPVADDLMIVRLH